MCKTNAVKCAKRYPPTKCAQSLLEKKELYAILSSCRPNCLQSVHSGSGSLSALVPGSGGGGGGGGGGGDGHIAQCSPVTLDSKRDCFAAIASRWRCRTKRSVIQQDRQTRRRKVVLQPHIHVFFVILNVSLVALSMLVGLAVLTGSAGLQRTLNSTHQGTHFLLCRLQQQLVYQIHTHFIAVTKRVAAHFQVQ